MTKHTPITLKFLAKKLNMSVSTVSKALNNYPTINQYTKDRVQQMAKEMNYTPNASALNLKERKSRTIGVILPNLLDYIFCRSIYGIDQLATKNGYNVIICQTYEDFNKEVELANMLYKTQVDGLIVGISKHTEDFTHLDQFETLGTPVVYYTRNPSYNLNCHKVIGNTYQGCYDATAFLIQKGHKRIAYLGGPKSNSFSHDRFNGYINALKDFDISFDASLTENTDFDEENTIKAVTNLFLNKEQPPSALVAFKEPILFDAIKYLRSIQYPNVDQIDCIGFGNTPLLSYLASPPIASIDEDPEAVGEQAISLLLKLIAQETTIKSYKKVMVDCKLIVH